MLEIHVTPASEEASRIADQYQDLGAEAVSFHDAGDQPISNLPVSKNHLDETLVIGLFPADFAMDPVLNYLEINPIPSKHWPIRWGRDL